MKTWEEVVDDRRWRYIDILRKAEELTLAQSAINELHMVLESCVPVVRCRDCEWWRCNPNTEEYGVCKKVSYDDFEVVMNGDDFCSYGLRR